MDGGKEPALRPTLTPSTTPQRQIDNDPVNRCVKRTLAMKLVEFLRTRGQTRPEGCPGRLPAEPRVGFEAGRDGPDSGAPEGRTPPSGSLGMRARGCGRLDTRSSRFETLPPEVLARNNLHRTRKRCGVTSAQSADGSSWQEPRADRGKREHNRTRQRRDRLLTLSSPHLALFVASSRPN